MALDLLYKSLLFKALSNELAAKLQIVHQSLSSISDSKSEETKSVMGDKHETSRVMLQREEEKMKQSFITLKNQQSRLKSLKANEIFSKVALGSLVHTDTGKYLITIPFGKLKVDNESVFCMSDEAPMAKAMMGKSKGEVIQFNNKEIQILDLI